MTILRDKKGRIRKGQHFSPKTEFKKGNEGFWKGKKRPNMSGDKNSRWSGGLTEKNCLECKKVFFVGTRKREKTAKFCSHSCRARWYFTGENNPKWKGGIPREQRDELLEYREWRKAVHKRYGWKCGMCKFKGKKIVVHHIRVWEHFPEERFLVDNGITLCRGCHCKLHTTNKDVIDFRVILRDYTFGSERR